MSKLRRYRYPLRALLGICALLILFIATNPNQVALGFLVVPVLIISFVTHDLMRWGFSFFASQTGRKRQQAISLIIAIATGLLLMLQSIGQLVAGDLAIIIFFALVSVFYISRFR